MPSIRKFAELRYYLYVSRTKIDMLYDQLYGPSPDRRLRLGVRTHVGSASLETESRERVDGEEKLRLVEDELRHRELIGDLDDPKDFIEATMPMRWGLYNDCGKRPDGEAALVYFGGFDKARPLMVGLGGSTRHVVGHDGASSTYSQSLTPVLVPWLLEAAVGEGVRRPPILREKETEEQMVLQGMAVALHNLKPPTQNLRFLARTFLTGTAQRVKPYIGVDEVRTILGSPLYVAQADSLPDADHWGLDEEW